MVRLEDGVAEVRQSKNTVSIPIWCDWKHSIECNRRSNNLFQFLYGAIGRIKIRLDQPLLPSFNSYMVRLEALGGNGQPAQHPFQFLYGAIGRAKQRDLNQ